MTKQPHPILDKILNLDTNVKPPSSENPIKKKTIKNKVNYNKKKEIILEKKKYIYADKKNKKKNFKEELITFLNKLSNDIVQPTSDTIVFKDKRYKLFFKLTKIHEKRLNTKTSSK